MGGTWQIIAVGSESGWIIAAKIHGSAGTHSPYPPGRVPCAHGPERGGQRSDRPTLKPKPERRGTTCLPGGYRKPWRAGRFGFAQGPDPAEGESPTHGSPGRIALPWRVWRWESLKVWRCGCGA